MMIALQENKKSFPAGEPNESFSRTEAGQKSQKTKKSLFFLYKDIFPIDK